MGRVRGRHFLGVALGALAAWVVILAFLVFYAVLFGYGPLAPFQGDATFFVFSGSMARAVLILLDLIIPFVAGVGFLLALAVLSRWDLPSLSFTSRSRAALEGMLLGLAVWTLFYIPVLVELAHPTLSQAVTPLLEGLVDHLAFGATMITIVFAVGGPVPFGRDAPPREGE